MRFSVILLFLQLWGNVKVSLSQHACSTPPDVPHAHISEETKKTVYQGGDVIHFTCEPGYASSSPTIRYVCSSEGWLAIQKDACLSMGCSRPPVDGGITVTGLPENAEPIRPGRLITFMCDGAGNYLNGSAVLICGEDGHWNNSFPSCGGPLNCGSPPPLKDGDTKETLKLEYSHGEMVEYICQNYYTVEGDVFYTCFNGKWIGRLRCLKPCTVDREALSTRNINFRYRSHSKLYVPHNDDVEFKCTEQRTLVGSVRLRQRCVDGMINLPTCR